MRRTEGMECLMVVETYRQMVLKVMDTWMDECPKLDPASQRASRANLFQQPQPLTLSSLIAAKRPWRSENTFHDVGPPALGTHLPDDPLHGVRPIAGCLLSWVVPCCCPGSLH